MIGAVTMIRPTKYMKKSSVATAPRPP